MFHGSIPGDMRSIIAEQVEGWDCSDVYIGCSGNFTIERLLAPMERFRLHSNDIQIYSCSLGELFAGRGTGTTIRPEWKDLWGWLDPYLEDAPDAVATMMIATRMLQGGLETDNPYYERIRQGFQDQWPVLHEKTLAKLEGLNLTVDSFHSGDVVEWMEEAPDDQGAVCFPPFFAKDYENMFRQVEDLVEWEAPEFEEFDEDRRARLLTAIQSKRHWIIGTHVYQDEMEEHLRGMVQTTNRGVTIYVYSNSPVRRIVMPRQPIEPVNAPRLGETEDVGDTITLAPLTAGQFATLRSEYMNIHIKPGQASLPIAVLVDGKIVGVFAISTAPTMANWDKYLPGPHVYLLSDFPVTPTKYKRLAKLVLMAALSKEGKQLAERTGKKRFRALITTAYTNNNVSMKYRGLFKLLRRKDAQDGRNKNQLEYGSLIGEWTLAEALDLWKDKHAGAR